MIVARSFLRNSVFKMFYFHTKTQIFVLKFLRFEERFAKLRFGDGLVWTVGLTVEIMLRFQISPSSVVWTSLI